MLGAAHDGYSQTGSLSSEPESMSVSAIVGTSDTGDFTFRASEVDSRVLMDNGKYVSRADFRARAKRTLYC